jgi:hypothetical protein
MPLGPIELLVVGFPGNRFTGRIIPEVERLVDAGIISVVDALLLHKDESGDVTLVELEEADGDDPVARLSRFNRHLDLVSDDDLAGFADALAPGSSAAALVFEHTWFLPLRDALVEADGVLLADLRVPGSVVQEVLDALETIDD